MDFFEEMSHHHSQGFYKFLVIYTIFWARPLMLDMFSRVTLKIKDKEIH